jgi:hypothetical protein
MPQVRRSATRCGKYTTNTLVCSCSMKQLGGANVLVCFLKLSYYGALLISEFTIKFRMRMVGLL